jgi:hypothetical protein
MSRKIYHGLCCVLILSLLALPAQLTHAASSPLPLGEGVGGEGLLPSPLGREAGGESLPTTPNWTAQSTNLTANFGWSVAHAGDVNGDGFGDLLVGAPILDGLGGVDSGRAYLYYGSASGLAAAPLWYADGGQAGAKFGLHVAGLGDVNNDGYDDVAISAPYDDIGTETDEGVIYVWYGSDSGLSCGAGCPVVASPATASWYAQPEQANARLYAVAGGDVNGDGYGDLVAGANRYDWWNPVFGEWVPDTGAVFVWSGSADGLANHTPGQPGNAFWGAYGEAANDRIGYRVAAVDVKHDGQADVLAGSWEYDHGQTDEGAVFAWYAPLSGSSSTLYANWKVEGDQEIAYLGYSIGTAGDVNGDNDPDLIVSAPYYDSNGYTNNGIAFVFHGSPTGLPGSGTPGGWQDVYDTANWKAATNINSTFLGFFVGSAGDVNTDGYDDVLIGDHVYNAYIGRASVFYGSSNGLSNGAGGPGQNPVDLETDDWTVLGEPGQSQFGYSVAGAGDVNGDQVSDVFVGAPSYDTNAADGGKAYGYYGVSENTPPVAVDDLAVPIYEDEVYVSPYSVLANDYDPGGNPNRLWAEFIIPPPPPNTVHGSVSMTPDGFFTYIPDANWNGEAIFDYAVWDGFDYDVGQVRIPITAVNDPPSFTKGADPTVNEDAGPQMITGWATNISPGPADEAGQTLWFVISGNTNPGLFAVAPAVDANNGALTFTPAADASGSAAITLYLQDNGGSGGMGNDDTSDPQSFTITVTPVNDPPVAVDDSAATPEDTAVLVSVLANDTDPDGDPLSIVNLTQPAHGAAAIEGAAIRYTPDVNYSGADSFTYQASDGQAQSSAATVSLTINPVNDPPVAVDDSVSTAQGTPRLIAVLGNDSDPDGDTLSIQSVTDPAHGSAVIQGTEVLYTPDPGYVGLDTFGYTCSDGHGGSDAAQVTVDVGNVNDPPTAVDDAATTAEDTEVGIPVLANDSDPDGDTLSISDLTQPAHGVAVIDGVTVRYTPSANYSGPDSFTYTASDGELTDTATVAITITAVNDPPIATDDSAETPEDTAVVIPVLANDSDPDAASLSIAAISLPAHGAAVIEGAAIRYTPSANYYGPDSFTYTVTDGALIDTAQVSLTVSAVNDAPTAGDDVAGTLLDTPVSISALANDTDADGDPLSLAQVSAPAHGAAVISGARVVYTPTTGYSGVDSFTYTVSDDRGGSDIAAVQVTVRETNTTPVAVDDSAETTQEAPVLIDVLDNDADADGDPLAITQVGAPAHGTAVISGTQVLYTPGLGYSGSDTFTYTITDGFATAAAAVTVDVTPAAVGYKVFLPLVVR